MEEGIIASQPGVVVVHKASGEQAIFDAAKLRTSLARAGAAEEDVEVIVAKVTEQLYQGITTKEIYRTAFAMLKTRSRVVAGKYNLKKGLLELGPSGFPFEKYIAALLELQGYETQTGQVVRGHCVSHEVDVVATKGNTRCMIECKYHNRKGVSSDVKIPLYIHSRFRDIEKEWMKDGKKYDNEGWLITNTRFTGDAIKYGSCAGLRLIGWDYPRKGNLRDWITHSGFYPVTCLTLLAKKERDEVLRHGVVLCRDLNRSLLNRIGIEGARVTAILRESHGLSEPQQN